MKLDPNGSTASPLTTERHPSSPENRNSSPAPMRMTAIRYASPAQQTATSPGNHRIATHPRPSLAQRCAPLESIWHNYAHLLHHLSASMRKNRVRCGVYSVNRGCPRTSL